MRKDIHLKKDLNLVLTTGPLQIFSPIVGIIVATIFVQFPPHFSIVFFLAILFFTLSLLNIEKALLIITLSRTALDCLREISRVTIGSFPLNITGFFSVFIILLGIVYFIFEKREINFARLFLPLFIFIGICIISIFYSPNKAGSIQELTRLVSYYVLALLIADVFNTKLKIQRFIKFFMCALIVPLSVGFYQLFFSSGLMYYGYNRLYGTLRHPSSYGKFLVMFLVIVLTFLIFKERTKKGKIINLLLLIILSLQIICTFTRVPWVESFIGIFLLWVFSRKRVVLFLLISAAILFMSTPPLKGRFTQELRHSSSFSAELVSPTNLTGSYKSRFLFNEFSFKEMFLKSPLFGKGIGSFFYYYSPRIFKEEVDTHGDLMKLLGEVGLIGTIAFFIGLLRIGKFLLKIKDKIRDPYLYSVIVSILCIFGVRLFGFIFDAELRLVIVQWYFWSLCGIALACSKLLILEGRECKELKNGKI